jgi:hypothetical protein
MECMFLGGKMAMAGEPWAMRPRLTIEVHQVSHQIRVAFDPDDTFSSLSRQGVPAGLACRARRP